MDKRPRDEGADGDDGVGKRARASSPAAGAADAKAARVAAGAGDAEALRSLPREALSAAGADGRTPAHRAALNGHDGCLRVLHARGASLCALTPNGGTPSPGRERHFYNTIL